MECAFLEEPHPCETHSPSCFRQGVLLWQLPSRWPLLNVGHRRWVMANRYKRSLPKPNNSHSPRLSSGVHKLAKLRLGRTFKTFNKPTLSMTSINMFTAVVFLPTLFALAVSAAVDSKDLPLEHRSGFPGPEGPFPPFPPPTGPLGPPQPDNNEVWPLSRADIPQIKNLNVLCEKNRMRVNVEFDRPFHGMIFSKGHFSDSNCVHLLPNSGFLTANFDVFLNNCGTSSSADQQGFAPSAGNAFLENTIIIQFDPLVQEVWDQARKLRCTWYDYYEKSVTFKPFNVDTLQAVQANFLGDNIQCWMQIQVGKGPWASEVSGIVKIGQTMTMVLAIKDDENKFDMLVRNCVAHDGRRPPIPLVDDFGCVVRPKVMSPFQKVRNFGVSASVVSYAYFQAFKFPDSMNVHFQCVIQVCRHECPEPSCGGAEDDFVDPRVVASDRNEIKVPSPNPLLPSPSPSSSSTPNQQATNTISQTIRTRPQPPIPTRGQPIPQAPLRLPYPPNTGYSSVGRDGIANVSGSYLTLNGRPRSAFQNDNITNETRDRRRRRDVPDAEKLSVPTATRIIQVVAPGDVAFNLGTGNETIVVTSGALDLERTAICMSMPGFVAGLVVLLLTLCVACMVAAFLYVRMRSFGRKNGGKVFENPEFTKQAEK